MEQLLRRNDPWSSNSQVLSSEDFCSQSVHCRCVSCPKPERLIPTRMCQMTEQRAAERNALIHPCTAATTDHIPPHTNPPTPSSDVTFIDMREATKHDANSIPVTFSARPDSVASPGSALESKQTHQRTAPHLFYQRPPHSERLQLCVCFTLRSQFPHCYCLH